MIDTLKRWIETIKSSAIAKPFITIKNWFQENVIKRKLVISPYSQLGLVCC